MPGYEAAIRRIEVLASLRSKFANLSLALTMLAAVLMGWGCSTASAPDADEEPDADRTALDQMTKLEDADARRIVEQLLAEYDLPVICEDGVETVKQSVRESVINVMFSKGLSDPRDSGTTAGHFIAERCREINPDY